MTLEFIKNYFERFPKETKFNIALSDPFSWRGVYAEVAFSIIEKESTAGDNLKMINEALTKTFMGWKGGEFIYPLFTDVHFEAEHGAWTDGGYVSEWIAKIEGQKPSQDNETRLINIGFTPTKPSKTD